MASKALKKTGRGVRYFSNIRAVVKQFQSSNAPLSTSSTDKATSSASQVTSAGLPDSKLGPFVPQDPRFPLPGNVGLDLGQFHSGGATAPSDSRKSLAEALLEVESEDLRKNIVMDTFFKDVNEGSTILQPDKPELVECSVQECPGFLHRSFMELFPDVGLKTGQLTVVSISQHTNNDMSSWSPDVEEERDTLMANFIENAKEICSNLKSQGYWADFIDPSSGTAFFGPHTTSTLFETDERFNHLGFNILDLGCCKVITHPLWGSRVFVGSIFTNAPAQSTVLGHVLER